MGNIVSFDFAFNHNPTPKPEPSNLKLSIFLSLILIVLILILIIYFGHIRRWWAKIFKQQPISVTPPTLPSISDRPTQSQSGPIEERPLSPSAIPTVVFVFILVIILQPGLADAKPKVKINPKSLAKSSLSVIAPSLVYFGLDSLLSESPTDDPHPHTSLIVATISCLIGIFLLVLAKILQLIRNYLRINLLSPPLLSVPESLELGEIQSTLQEIVQRTNPPRGS